MANTFFWRCEGTTLDGTHDNSAGDTTATANASAAINTAQVKVGTNSHDCASGTSYYSFDLASDIVLSAGSAGFWIYPDNWAAGMIFWQALDVSSTADHIFLTKTGSSGSGGITLEVKDAGFGQSTITTGDLGITTGNWYFVTFGWDEANTSLYIHVFDSTLTELAAATEDTAVTAAHFPPWANLDDLRLGHQSGTGNSAHFDNYMISDSYSEDLVSNANITSYTSWGAGSSTVETIPSGTLELVGIVPSTNTIVPVKPESIPVGTLELIGVAPSTNTVSDVSAESIPVGTLTLTGFAPRRENNYTGVESITLTGFAPEYSINGLVAASIPVATFELTGFAPGIFNPRAQPVKKGGVPPYRRWKQRRTVLIGGQRYVVRSYTEERYLLERYIKSLQKKEATAHAEPVELSRRRKIKLIGAQIKRTETRMAKLDQEIAWHRNKLKEEDELLLSLFG